MVLQRNLTAGQCICGKHGHGLPRHCVQPCRFHRPPQSPLMDFMSRKKSRHWTAACVPCTDKKKVHVAYPLQRRVKRPARPPLAIRSISNQTARKASYRAFSSSFLFSISLCKTRMQPLRQKPLQRMGPRPRTMATRYATGPRSGASSTPDESQCDGDNTDRLPSDRRIPRWWSSPRGNRPV